MSPKKNRIAAISLLALLVTANAQDRGLGTVMVNGVGTHSCGKYLEFRKAGNEAMSNLYQQWAAGYFAGYSHAVTKPGTHISLAADLETYTAWLDKWCLDDPSSNVSAGLVSFRLKLQSKK